MYEFEHPLTLELGDTEAQHEARWSADEAANVTLEQVKVGDCWLSATLIKEWVGAAEVKRQTDIVDAWWADRGLAQFEIGSAT